MKLKFLTILALFFIASPTWAGRIWLDAAGSFGTERETHNRNFDQFVTCNLAADQPLVDACIWHAAYPPDAVDDQWEWHMHWTSDSTDTTKQACVEVCVHTLPANTTPIPSTAFGARVSSQCFPLVDTNTNDSTLELNVGDKADDASTPATLQVFDNAQVGVNCDLSSAGCANHVLWVYLTPAVPAPPGCTNPFGPLAIDGRPIKVRALEMIY